MGNNIAWMALVAGLLSSWHVEAAQGYVLTTTGNVDEFEIATTVVKPATAVRLTAPGCAIELASGHVFTQDVDSVEIVIADPAILRLEGATFEKPGAVRYLSGTLRCPTGALPDPTQFLLERQNGDGWRRDGFRSGTV